MVTLSAVPSPLWAPYNKLFRGAQTCGFGRCHCSSSSCPHNFFDNWHNLFQIVIHDAQKSRPHADGGGDRARRFVGKHDDDRGITNERAKGDDVGQILLANVQKDD